MPRPRKQKSKRVPASRRLETRSSGPTALAQHAGKQLLLPHELDQAAVSEERTLIRRNRRPIRQAVHDVQCGLVDTEARGTPANVPAVGRRRPGAKRTKRRTH